LEQELLQQIPEWEAAHQIPFRVNDERIVETLADSVEADTVQKDSKKVRIHLQIPQNECQFTFV
jgi:hypothetical protein